jgi:hypothetical protein
VHDRVDSMLLIEIYPQLLIMDLYRYLIDIYIEFDRLLLLLILTISIIQPNLNICPQNH